MTLIIKFDILVVNYIPHLDTISFFTTNCLHWPRHHELNQRAHHLGSSESSHFTRIIINGSNFHHISTNDIQPRETIQNGQQFSRAPSAGLCSSRRRSIRGIERVNVHGDVHWGALHAVFQVLDEIGSAEFVEIAGGEDVETAGSVVFQIVLGVGYGGSDSGVDG